MLEITILIIGMALVTYIPRALPAVLIDKFKFSKRMERFLSFIPYTAMTALMFPGILYVDENSMKYGIAGGVTAIILSVVKAPLIVTVLGAVGVNMLLYLI